MVAKALQNFRFETRRPVIISAINIKENAAIHQLNEIKATTVCGNDISSSCLYVWALTIAYAGQYAWISLLIVALVLFLFRKIYGEVVGALPLNGGA